MSGAESELVNHCAKQIVIVKQESPCPRLSRTRTVQKEVFRLENALEA
jgi:hypothetical protein